MASKDRRENGSAMDDTEFEKLLDEMDELGRQADVLREKVNHLIDEMRENDVVADEAADGEGKEDSEAVVESVIEDAGAAAVDADTVDEEAEEDGNPEDSFEEEGERETVDDSENPPPQEPPAAGTTI